MEATLPVDLIHSYLPLSANVDPAKIIKPDYSKSIEDVLIHVAKHLYTIDGIRIIGWCGST